MNRILAVGIIDLSDNAINVMQENGIDSLQELIIQRDLGFVNSGRFDEEILRELLSVCQKIDEFNNGLRKKIAPIKMRRSGVSQKGNESSIKNRQSNGLAADKRPVDEGRRRTREGIVRDLASISNLETPTSLRKAILKLMIDCPNKGFDRKTIKETLERRYKNTISINSDAIRSTLSSLESHMFIMRTNNPGYYRITKYALNEFSKCSNANNYFEETEKVEYLKEKELDDFIHNNIKQEIEFRYKSERARSDKWWRRVKVYDQDDRYLYVADFYPSGGRVRYLKERIIEYRRVDNGEI